MAAQIEVKNLSMRFGSDSQQVSALENIDLDITSGEFVCLLGPSGCGKSTLLNLIAGFLLPTQGSVTVNGAPVTAPGADRGLVFEGDALFAWMPVADNIAFGLRIKHVPRAQINARVDELLHLLGLSDFRSRFPKDLSGGMRQRVAIARVLALDSPILLMDEPFGALDALTRRTLQDELLRLWQKLRKTVVFVTHSIEEAIYLADRVVVMTYRPGTIKRDERIALPRPRDPSSNEFNALKRELALLVTAEQERHIESERRGVAVD
jgi:NitT/TauT family transport system ATP-binding protein